MKNPCLFILVLIFLTNSLMGYFMQSIKTLLEIKLLLKAVRLGDSCTHTVKCRQHRHLILPSCSGSIFPTAGSFLM